MDDSATAGEQRGDVRAGPDKGREAASAPSDAPPPSLLRTAEQVIDRVHDDSVDSFPASDPPSWMGMWVGPPGGRRAPN
jgi:hypothetical protein